MPEDQNQAPESGWSYRQEQENSYASDVDNGPYSDQEPISWVASEYISQTKNGGWYAALFGAIVLVCGVVYLVSRDLLSVVFLSVMGILFAVIASRKPRQMQYTIDAEGILIGNREYDFGSFKSFSLQHDGAVGYISLLPLKRFMPEIVIYYAPEDEQRIFDALALNLPNENHKENITDKFARIIRF